MSSDSNNGNNDRRQRTTSRRSSTSDALPQDSRHPQMAVRRASTYTTITLSSWSEPNHRVSRRGSSGNSLSISRRGSAASTLSMSSLGDSSFLMIDEDLLAEIISPRLGRRDSLLSIIGTAIDVAENTEEGALAEPLNR